MNKYIPPILGALIGVIIGVAVASSNPIIKLLGIAIPTAIVLYYRKSIQEVFLKHDADKVISILLVAVIGAGMIIITNLDKTQWQLFILWGAWLIFSISLLGKLSLLITEYEFALVTKDNEMKQARRIIEPYLKRAFEGKEKKNVAK